MPLAHVKVSYDTVWYLQTAVLLGTGQKEWLALLSYLVIGNGMKILYFTLVPICSVVTLQESPLSSPYPPPQFLALTQDLAS